MADGSALVPSAGAVPAMSFSDRVRAWIDARLGDPRFQRWAAAFPLTRPVARRRARALFDLCAGFVYSQVLLACVRLGLFEILAEGPQRVDALAPRLRLTEERARRLLDAAASIGLVAARRDGRYALGPHGAALRANPGIAAMVDHHALVYRDLADPVALLRDDGTATGLGRYWPYSRAERPEALTDSDVAAYSRLMSESQPLVADEILAAYPLDRHRCLLDLGGGEGTFLRHVATRVPHLRLMLADLPAVAARAELRFAEAGIAHRASAHGGDFRRDSLPQGADIVSLVRVLHDHDDESALQILRCARAALPAGGTLLIGEPMAAAPGAETVGAAYFGFYLLAMGQGRARTPKENLQLIQAAGFENIEVKQTNMPLQTGVMVARAARHM